MAGLQVRCNEIPYPILVSVIGLFVFFAFNARAADLTLAEQAVVFKAAGFREAKDGRHIRCEEEATLPSTSPGSIELDDLNNDGQPEAWVKETNLYCYGEKYQTFVLLTKRSGRWRVILDDTGIPELDEKHRGWPDITVGGPGVGKFPVYRWNGKSYTYLLHR